MAGNISTRFFHFSFLRSRPEHEPRLHELRDGDAFAELAMALAARGCVYGGLLLNHSEPEEDVLRLLRPHDMVVLTTRPPLNDHDGWDRNPIPRSEAPLEGAILAGVARYFDVCRRSSIRLNERTAAHLGEAADRAEIHFHVYKRSHYRRYRNPYSKGAARRFLTVTRTNATAAFLISTSLGPRGPHLLNAFGMDGTTTLVWCYLLRTRFPYLLDGPRVVLAEIEATQLPQRPSTLAFADAWTVRLLLDLPLPQASA